MKRDKNTVYYVHILNGLSNGKVCSTAQLAGDVGLSEKTVRTKIKQMSGWMEEKQLGKICRKPGTGIWLEAEPEQKNRMRILVESGENILDPLSARSRNLQLMCKLLQMKPGELTTIQRLAESLYLSSPTVANMLRDVRPWFEEHGLHISSFRNKGLCLTGDEYRLRIAIKDYLLYRMPEPSLEQFAADTDGYRVRRIVTVAECAWRLELSDEAFHMVWILCCLSLSRMQFHTEQSLWENRKEEIRHHAEYTFAEQIYRRMSVEFCRQFPQTDTVLLAVHLISAKRVHVDKGSNRVKEPGQYNEKLQNDVRKLIRAVDDVLDAELDKDDVLFESLLIHMRAALFRMKYSTSLADGVSDYVKGEYGKTFHAVWSVRGLLEMQYGIPVTTEELAGITLYIQAALMRREKREPLSAVLITQKGLAESQLMMEMLRCSLPEITEIRTVSYHDFSEHHCVGASLIVSTVCLKEADERIVCIGESFSGSDMEAVREKINQLRKAGGSVRALSGTRNPLPVQSGIGLV